MKLTGIFSTRKYEITTTAKLPKKIMELYGIEEVAFSPNPFDPVIVYHVDSVAPNFQHLIDYIIDAERKH